MIMKLQTILDFIRTLYNTDEFIGLHEPYFDQTELDVVHDCIKSTFVSSTGQYVTEFENLLAKRTGAKRGVAVVNGTEALYLALHLAGVTPGDIVITQSATFVGTGNAILRLGAIPIFVDIGRDTPGMNPEALSSFLKDNTAVQHGRLIHTPSGRRIAAVTPMHTFGIPCRIIEIRSICDEFGLPLVEDAAESLGSYYKGRHTGLFGLIGILSFNGNKIITTGGGGMLLTDDNAIADRAKHLSTTAKKPHPYEFDHDEPGFNMRMPNINAALGVAQLSKFDRLLDAQRSLAAKYRDFFSDSPWRFIDEGANSQSNFWLNAILMRDRAERDEFLQLSNAQNVMTRALWKPLHSLPMFASSFHQPLPVTEELYDRLVNIPSSVGRLIKS